MPSFNLKSAKPKNPAPPRGGAPNQAKRQRPQSPKGVEQKTSRRERSIETRVNRLIRKQNLLLASHEKFVDSTLKFTKVANARIEKRQKDLLKQTDDQSKNINEANRKVTDAATKSVSYFQKGVRQIAKDGSKSVSKEFIGLGRTVKSELLGALNLDPLTKEITGSLFRIGSALTKTSAGVGGKLAYRFYNRYSNKGRGRDRDEDPTTTPGQKLSLPSRILHRITGRGRPQAPEATEKTGASRISQQIAHDLTSKQTRALTKLSAAQKAQLDLFQKRGGRVIIMEDRSKKKGLLRSIASAVPGFLKPILAPLTSIAKTLGGLLALKGLKRLLFPRTRVPKVTEPRATEPKTSVKEKAPKKTRRGRRTRAEEPNEVTETKQKKLPPRDEKGRFKKATPEESKAKPSGSKPRPRRGARAPASQITEAEKPSLFQRGLSAGKSILQTGKRFAVRTYRGITTSLKYAEETFASFYEKNRAAITSVVNRAKAVISSIAKKFPRIKTQAVTEYGEKVLLKATPAVSKGMSRVVLKAVPIIGTALGLYFAYSRLMDGDLLGALLEVISAFSIYIPFVGPAISIALSGSLMYRDLTTESQLTKDSNPAQPKDPVTTPKEGRVFRGPTSTTNPTRRNSYHVDPHRRRGVFRSPRGSLPMPIRSRFGYDDNRISLNQGGRTSPTITQQTRPSSPSTNDIDKGSKTVAQTIDNQTAILMQGLGGIAHILASSQKASTDRNSPQRSPAIGPSASNYADTIARNLMEY